MLTFANVLTDIIVIAIIVLIIGGSLIYIIRAKLNGQKCIGCPHSKTCASNKRDQSESSCNCDGGDGCCCNK